MIFFFYLEEEEMKMNAFFFFLSIFFPMTLQILNKFFIGNGLQCPGIYKQENTKTKPRNSLFLII